MKHRHLLLRELLKLRTTTLPTNVIFNTELCRNEREVESKLIVSYLLPELGYDISMWHQQAKRGRFRLDFLAYTEHNNETACRIVVEAKHPGRRLIEGRYQLKNYMLRLQIDYGLLTNGRELAIYRRFGDTRIEPILTCQVEHIAANLDAIRVLIGRQQLVEQNIQAVTYAADIPVPVIPKPATVFKESVPPVEDLSNMKILAIFHNKGGVGKTTTTVNLADAIARTGKKVLIIDMDSQANATFATGLMNFGDELADDIRDNYVFHLLSDPTVPLSQVARKSRYSPKQDIDVVPAHILLMRQEKKLAELSFINIILLEKIKKATKAYDIVIIDTPPSLGLYTKVSLLAAGYLLIPSDLKVFANSGLENVKELISETDATKEMYGMPKLKLLGILPTKILSNAGHVNTLKNQRIPKIEAIYGIPVLKNHMIIERVDLARSFDQHVEVGDLDIPDPKSIFEFAPNSPAVGEFEELAAYIMEQMELPR